MCDPSVYECDVSWYLKAGCRHQGFNPATLQTYNYIWTMGHDLLCFFMNCKGLVNIMPLKLQLLMYAGWMCAQMGVNIPTGMKCLMIISPHARWASLQQIHVISLQPLAKCLLCVWQVEAKVLCGHRQQPITLRMLKREERTLLEKQEE